MFKKIGMLLVILCLFALIISPATAQTQQSNISVSNSSVQVRFPTTLTFNSSIRSNVNITDIRLRYTVEQMGFARVVSEGFVNLLPSTTLNATWTMDLRRIGGLPPGTKIDYWWMVKNAAGEQLETPPENIQFNDGRYNWREISEGKVTISWYNGNETFAGELMSTAQQSLVKLAQDTGAVLEQPVKIFIYASPQDLQGAMIFPQEWTGGVAFSQHGIISIGIAPSNLTWGKGAMTHELTHLVFYQMTNNPYNQPPVWLNEGMAMYAEGVLGPQFTGPLNKASS